MILTIQQLARAVAVSLEDEVLPAFEARSWPASRIRSSLGLLQLIIDQAEHEEQALSKGNRLMRAFLQSADGGAPETVAAAGGADVQALRRDNQQLRARLSERIRASRSGREKGADAGAEREALHQLLRELAALEKPIYDEAIRFLPM